MTLEEYAYLAEIIGSVGVVVSLLYVGRQLKQTNSMTRAAAHQAFGAQTNAFAISVATAPDLAAAMVKVLFHDLVREEATDLERVQLGFAFTAVVGNAYLAFEQMKVGVLGEHEAEATFGRRTPLASKPYLKSLWPILREAYPEDFVIWFEGHYGVGGLAAT